MYKLLVGIAVLVTYTWMYALGQEEKPADEGFVIEQVCNGFPGTKQKKKTKQKVIIKDDKIYMENLESPNICIVRGDKKEIWEIHTAEKAWDKRLYEYFDELKKEKEAIRKTAVKQLNGMPDPKARAELAEDAGYTVGENGYVPAKVVAWTEEKINEEKVINGFKCYRVKIHEDGHVVLDMWLAKSLKAPKSLIEFYSKLGCFADETVKEVRKIKDFPIALNADIDFGTVVLPVKLEISKVEKKKIAASQFELPKGLPEKPRSIIGKKRIDPRVPCPVCGKMVDPNATGKNKPTRFRKGNVGVIFCSRECYNKFLIEYRKNKGDLGKTMRDLARELAKKQKEQKKK